MAKLLKLRRGTTTQHASFTGAEGEVTIDTTKDTAVVHDGSQAGGKPLAKEDMSNVSSASIAGRLGTDSIAVEKIAAGSLPNDVNINSTNIIDGSITSSDIADGTIVNADIASNAAIAGTKLENSGVVAGSYGSSSAIPIVTVDAQGLVTSASTTSIDSTRIDNGTSNVRVTNNGKTEISVAGTDRLDVNGNGVDVVGNLTVTGTVDGRDVASDGNKLDGIEAGSTGDQTASEVRALVGSASDSNVFTDADHAKLDAITTSNGVILNGVTATTQAQSDNSTKISTTAYVRTAVSDLVNSSPSSLDTLKELSDALGADANFSTTVTNSIATKLATNGNGSSVTNLNASNLASGTIPDARFPSTLPAVSGANLTGIVSFVSGMIIIWSGSTGSIPSGWVLCNGSNSTPDLRDRFVVGAGNSYGVGNTGGSTTRSDTVNISGSDTVNISGSDTVNISVSGNAQGDIRQYGGINTYYATGYNHNSNAKLDLTHHVYTGTRLTIPFSGSGSDTVNISGSDTVNISGSDTVNIDTRSPYYALCYIMKT